MTTLDFSVFTTADAWVSLLTLTFLEIVLGVDNVIFISIVADKLPKNRQKQARNIGMLAALGIRVLLLFLITWIIGLTKPLLTLNMVETFRGMGLPDPEASAAISGRDLILLLGGLFLLAKSVTEIHNKVEGRQHDKEVTARESFFGVILQIILIDIVFSFDSILTAVGLTQHLAVMVIAVIIAILIMIQFAGAISRIINRYPTLQILALSFLIMIGLTLVLESFDMHINKAFVYVAVLFSLSVEMLNLRFRKKHS